MTDAIAKKLNQVDYFVEATSTEMNLLWVTNVQRPNPIFPPLPWQEIYTGLWTQIETTCVQFWFARIYGKLVAFYSPTSTKVDWEEVENYVDAFCKMKNGRKMKCDDGNFHQCIRALRLE